MWSSGSGTASRSGCSRPRPERRARAAARCAKLWMGLALAPWLASCVSGGASIVPHVGALESPWSEPAPAGPGPAIAIGPVIDRRTELSRVAQHPRLRPALLGVMWVGERSTGDGSFDGDIAAAARRDLAATLRYSGMFRAVWLKEELPSDARPELVLTAEIEELVGFQYRRVEMNVFQAGLLSTRADPPIGTARVRFELRDRRGRSVWREPIETRLEVERHSMEQAALDALAVTHERLVVELARRWSQPKLRPVRDLPVRVLDACGLGAKKAGRLIEDASEIFELELGVRLVPRVENWVPPGSAGGADRILDAAADQRPPSDGVVLALAPLHAPLGLPDPRAGLARQLGRHALVACDPVAPRPSTVAHELGHLFGAIHVRRRGSIMYPVSDFDARFFDPLNRRILSATRERPFGESLPAPMVRTLRTLYESARDVPEYVELDDLTEASAGL